MEVPEETDILTTHDEHGKPYWKKELKGQWITLIVVAGVIGAIFLISYLSSELNPALDKKSTWNPAESTSQPAVTVPPTTNPTMTEPAKFQPTAQDFEKLKIKVEDFVWRKDDSAYDYVRGTIKNDSSLVVRYWTVVAYFQDKSGKTVDSGLANDLGRLLPGETKRFEIMHKAVPEAKKCWVKVDEVRFGE